VFVCILHSIPFYPIWCIANKCGDTDTAELGNASCFDRRPANNVLTDEQQVTNSASRMYQHTTDVPTHHRDGAVGITTRYEMDGPGDRITVGARFSAPVQTGPGAYPAPYTMGTGSSPGVQRPWRGVEHPPPSGAEVKYP
jgi:hypothetical protein